MINDYSNGGLKMIDIQSFNKSLKAMWIEKYLDSGNQGKWKLFFDLEIGKSVEKTALTSNLSQQDITKTIATKNSFVREVLTIWAEINFEKRITSKTQFLSDVTKSGNGEPGTRNQEPGTRNQEPGTGNGERKSGNERSAVFTIKNQNGGLKNQ